MKKSDILKQREIHRGDPKELVLHFLVNYSAPARLMHSFLPSQMGKEEILQAAMRAYIIGIAASVETFFRDLLFYLLKCNPNLLKDAIEKCNRTESASRLQRYLNEGVSAEEFAASASFQNAESIDKNLSIYFVPSFFEVIDQFELVCTIPSARRTGPARLKLPLDWKGDLSKVFSLRHEFAHDANSKTLINLEEMRRIETTVLLICQMTIFLPNVKSKTLVGDKGLPTILLIRDLITDDWEIIGNDSVKA